MHRLICIIMTFVSGLGLLLASPVAAQDHPAVERGFAADKLYQLANLDSVSLMNGAVSVQIPIGGTYSAGGSLSYQLNLVYASKLWDFEEIDTGPIPITKVARSMPARHTTAGFGWTLSLGRLIAPDDPSNETGRWQYLDPMGGRHGLYSSLHPFDAIEAGVTYSRDSTYLRMTELASGDLTVEFPDGTVHTFTDAGLLISIEDRFGNHLDVAYSDEGHLGTERRAGPQPHGVLRVDDLGRSTCDGGRQGGAGGIRRHHRHLRLHLQEHDGRAGVHRHLSH